MKKKGEERRMKIESAAPMIMSYGQTSPQLFA